MSTHFDAFISYRHCRLDSAVAQRIHRQLERFHVPGPIRKATGKKSIRRIFRDKEELPLTVDLTSDIEEALNNSDYLIVICSLRTKESRWVEREINLFLRSHSIDRVLIVLAEGEPEDVVPSVLTEGREPLCCDFRMTPRKAKQIELPRLAAAILGCRYDDLRRRQRQHRTRQAMAVLGAALAAALVLAGYFFYTTQQIRKNYQQALINQSRYLAASALELADEGDRLTAIELALAALPSADNDRPWVAEAEYALGVAVNAYSHDAQLLPAAAFAHNDTVSGFLADEDGSHIISWDNSEQVYVWDAQTHQLLHTANPGFSIGSQRDVILLPDNKLVLTGSDAVVCYDYVTGESLWSCAAQQYSIFSDAIAAPDGTRLLIGTQKMILTINAATGETEASFPLPESVDYISKWICMRPDGGAAVFSHSAYSQDPALYLLSLPDGNISQLPVTLYTPDCGFFLENGNLCLTGQLENTGYPTVFLNLTMLKQHTQDVVCLDGNTGKQLWHTPISLYQTSYGGQIGMVGEHLYYCFSNIVIILDPATGRCISRGEASAPIIDAVVTKGHLRIMTSDGTLGSYDLDEHSIGAMKYFPDELSGGLFVNDYLYYILPGYESKFYLYDRIGDEESQEVEGAQNLPLFLDTVHGQRQAVISHDKQLTGVDLVSNKVLWQTDWDGDDRMYSACIGLSHDASKLYFLRRGSGYGDTAVGDTLLIIDTATGKTERMPLPELKNCEYASIRRNAHALLKDRIAYIADAYTMNVDPNTGAVENSGEDILILLDPVTGQHQQQPLPVRGVNYTLADPTGRYLLLGFVTDEDTTGLMIWDTAAQTGTRLADGFTVDLQQTSHARIAWSPDGSCLAIPYSGNTLLLDPAGTELTAIETGNRDLFSLTFHPDGTLWLIYTDQFLCRYDIQGNLLSQTELQIYVGGMHDYVDVDWTFAEDCCTVTINNLCNLIDTQTWSVYAYVPSCLFYSSASDCFYLSTTSDDGYALSYYRRYSTQDLIEKGRQSLGSYTMSQEVRKRYGLDG